MELVFPISKLDTIKQLEPFMLLNSNIKYTDNSDNPDNPDKEMDNKNKANTNFQKMAKNKKPNIKSNNFFWPKEKDQLFWCFYISLYDIEKYQDNRAKVFTIENDFKIHTVEKLRNIKDQLKTHKIRLNPVEDELVNSKKITTASIPALCLLYKKNIVIVRSRIYYLFCYDQDNSEYNLDNYNTIFNLDDRYYIDYELTNDKFKSIIETYYRVDNLDKPLKAPSSYTLKELQDIATKLAICLVGENDKNRTKNVLYELILEKMI